MKDSMIKKALEAKAAAEEAAKPQPKPEWAAHAEKALKPGKPQRATVASFAESIRKGGYPKTLTFAGACVCVADEKDMAAFWKTVFANLTKDEYAKLGESELTEFQVASALRRVYGRVKVAQDLVENGIDAGALEIEVDGVPYVIAGGLAIDLSGAVVCDVSDVQAPFGPDEWAEVAGRIRDSLADGEDDGYYDDEEDY
jgi:hypothetical protein